MVFMGKNHDQGFSIDNGSGLSFGALFDWINCLLLNPVEFNTVIYNSTGKFLNTNYNCTLNT